MIDLHVVTQFVLENFQQVDIKNNGTHFLCRCPLCGDSKKNPYKKRFNLNWNVGNPGYHCFNCGERGNFIKIYSLIKGISYENAQKELFKYDKKNIKTRISTYRNRPILKDKKEIEENNFNWILHKSYGIDEIQDGILKKKYISELNKFYDSRKIPKKYNIFICYEGKYKNRIIIPIFNEEGDVIYFQARSIPGSNIEPKYDNPPSPKELCILNKNKFDRNKSIIITEGIIDAYMIGDQGTTCLGKEIKDDFIEHLLKLTNKNIVISLDNDSEGYKSLFEFMKKSKYKQKVKYFIYPSDYSMCDDINNIVTVKKNVDVYDMIMANSVDYFNASIQLKINSNKAAIK